MKTKKIVSIMSIILVVLLGVCGVVYGMSYKNKMAEAKESDASSEPDDVGSNGYITYEGQRYKPNADVKAVLFMGIDNKGTKVDVNGYPGENGQSDSLMLFAMNAADKTTQLIQISRSTMTDIKIYNVSGEYIRTENAQITLQFAYGDGREKSCQLTKSAVENLLYDIPIRSYISLNMEGVDAVVDAIGGVELFMKEDWTMIDPAFTQGSTVKLNGAQAEHFVRYRDVNVDGSNEQRVDRQTYFMMSLASRLKDSFKINPALYNMIIGSADAYMLTDMSADQMQQLSDYEMSEEVLKLPGEVQKGVKYSEYIVNDAELYKMLIKVFYKPVN